MNAQPNVMQAQGMPVTIHAQYVKDISFENPNAPKSLQANQAPPQTNIQINMEANRIEDTDIPDCYEITLSVSAEAVRGKDEVVFIAEVFYGVVVQVSDQVPEERHHPLLLIEIPKFAFPYIRKILSDLTTEGGYPPLMLTPVDFHALYMQKFAQQQAPAQETKKPAPKKKAPAKKAPAKKPSAKKKAPAKKKPAKKK